METVSGGRPLGPLDGGRYPDPRVERLDPRFPTQANAAIERLATGCRWAEGPVWFGDGRFLLWSDIPNNRMLRWNEEDGHVSVFRSPSRCSNGNVRDRSGRLVTCEHLERRVVRTERDGSLVVLADRHDGRRLNSPNDVVVARDGAVWFTDPTYGIDWPYEGQAAQSEQPPALYRIDPGDGRVECMAQGFVQPNGLAFSPDERRLYVVDSGVTHGGPAHVRVFAVEGGRLSGGEVLLDGYAPAFVDGLKVDRDGNLWCSMSWGDPELDGVHCFSPEATPLGRVRLPEACANLCFGGLLRNRLFMTASTSLYALYVNTQGAVA